MANPNPDTRGLRKPWQKGESGNPKGRPPDPAKAMLEAALGKRGARRFERLTKALKDDIDTILESATTDTLTFISEWESAPAYAKCRALAILGDMEKGRTTQLDRMYERRYGKIVQKLEVTGADGEALMPNSRQMTQQEAREFLRKLEEDN